MSEQPEQSHQPDDSTDDSTDGSTGTGPSQEQLPGRRADGSEQPDPPDPAPPSAEEDDGSGSVAGAG